MGRVRGLWCGGDSDVCAVVGEEMSVNDVYDVLKVQ